MAYIDSTYFDAICGVRVRNALFTDDAVYDGARFDRMAAKATARVRAALKGAGYTPPSDSALTAMIGSSDEAIQSEGETIRSAALGQFLAFAAPRKQWRVPREFKDDLSLVEKIEDGTLEFESLPLTTRDAVGGVDFTSTDSSVEDAEPRVFSRTMGR